MATTAIFSPLFYLASPYSHEDPFMREWRYHLAKKAIVFLLSDNLFTISPIVHSHHLGSDLPMDHLFWANYNRALLERCDGLIVLGMDGWAQSKGVRLELALARRLHKEILWLKPTAKGQFTFVEGREC